jgi:hypothetical protein
MLSPRSLRKTVRHATAYDNARVYLPRRTRETLARLSPDRRQALRDGLLRVGQHLLESARQVVVDPGWAAGTWPRRRYPQQCYPKTTRYALDHPDINGLQLVHGVVSHGPHFLPLDHAWVELPGDVVFDGVVQRFFTRASYYAAMSAVILDRYSVADAQRLLARHGHPGPWNLKWVPTPGQIQAYADAAPAPQDGADRNR